MKFFRKCLIGMMVLVIAALVLAWFLPAAWVLPVLQPRWHGVMLEQVHGSIWDGSAGKVSLADGQRLGALRWRLSRRLLLGEARLQINLHGAYLDFSGDADRLDQNKVAWHDVRARAELAHFPLAMMPALHRPGGEVTLAVDHALLQGDWPLQLQAAAQWQGAVIHDGGKIIILGDLQASAQAQDGVLSAEMHDTGTGPFQVNLLGALSPLGWRLQGTMSSRDADPVLRQWLKQFGRPDASGKVHVQRSGGLAATLPEAPPPGPKHDP